MVRKRRLEQGMSQEQLGDALGVCFQQIQKYEKGLNKLFASRLLVVAETLQVPVAYFFDGIPDMETRAEFGIPEPAESGGELSAEELFEFTQALSKLDGATRRELLDMARAFIPADETQAEAA